MKTAVLLLAAAGAFTLGNIAHSQAPAVPQTSLQKLQVLRQKNKELIDRQTATLQVLEALGLEAQQIKALGKRS